jgi:hypothetical protein
MRRERRVEEYELEPGPRGDTGGVDSNQIP